MIQIIDVHEPTRLEDYAASSRLVHGVQELQRLAEQMVDTLSGRTVWMVNSTAAGGGVAEMMPKLVSLLRDLGLQVEWVVIDGEDPAFFALTKRLHNMLHGVGDASLSPEERALYASVSRKVFEALREHVSPQDVLVVHDPQPLAAGAMLKKALGLPAIWRCHIGIDEPSEASEAAWRFLKPWALEYDQAVFSVPDYVPPFLSDLASIIPPAIDPLSDKNRELSVHKVAGILSNAGLADAAHLTLTEPYGAQAQRLQADGSFAPAYVPDDLGLLHRPVVMQVSRWDRLKGFGPLLQGFASLKKRRHRYPASSLQRRRLDLARLVLAGPDPRSVQDDPEGLEVFENICRLWRDLDPDVRRDAAVLVLPMDERRDNALMVNALQRCATVVAQNSVREGFGLTVTEAMWKRCPVLGTQAAGIRSQVQDGTHGRLLRDAEDPEEIARVLDEMLSDAAQRERWAQNAQRTVTDRFLIFSQLRRWLSVLSQVVSAPAVIPGAEQPGVPSFQAA